ncbi:DUF1772 domain-containing protein [Mucilaginibacter gynuensis]|uniref:DUF1772 domain-containing protein n=1 Tax=Mucilaginibacter gynuensis TaxID=1302236 RepID=A0ABP8GM41_9SPHI
MQSMILNIFNGLAIVATAVVFGTDVFFAVVGRKAVAKSKDGSIADLIGHFHEIADQRMPVFGVLAIITILMQVVLNGLSTLHGQFSVLSLIALLTHLMIYVKISKPINKIMVEGIKFGRMIGNIRELQQRWDSVIYLRAGVLLIALTGSILINYL